MLIDTEDVAVFYELLDKLVYQGVDGFLRGIADTSLCSSVRSFLRLRIPSG